MRQGRASLRRWVRRRSAAVPDSAVRLQENLNTLREMLKETHAQEEQWRQRSANISVAINDVKRAAYERGVTLT